MVKKSDLSKDVEIPREVESEKGENVEAPRVSEYQPRILYPAKIMKDEQKEQFKKF